MAAKATGGTYRQSEMASNRSSSSRPAKAPNSQSLRADGTVPSNGSGPQMCTRSHLDGSGAILSNGISPGTCDIAPMKVPGGNFTVSTFQHLGDRRTQEDRFVVVPILDWISRTQPCAFFGVFDGTVGDFASENVKDLVIPKLMDASRRNGLGASSTPTRGGEAGGLEKQKQLEQLESTMHDLYSNVDEALLKRCSDHSQHYATCTSVTAMIMGDLVAVSHLGDSRVVLAKAAEGTNEIIGQQMTQDHKPDLDSERQRIESCGGMVERLQNHSNKPFIRGGDFLMRKALGEQPMQLQYSRAFGAKDLKVFGLSNVPTVTVFRMGSPQFRNCKCLILASDGLWDVVTAQQAAHVAMQHVALGESPAEALVRMALLEQSRRKARADNITATVVVFD